MSATIVYCRYCHQRLFDITPGTKGRIQIKCSRCRRIINVTLLEPQKNKDYQIAGETNCPYRQMAPPAFCFCH